ncbi:hypothetical protein B0H19DRAFT_658519 [Mycena capillaripes]|nr:hypothetical protein B0H19DRAFT_658519 [Mycena capillaripes]
MQPPPTFPEDVERIITEALLENATNMSGTMALVAPRFRVWCKPTIFSTVVVRRRDNWMERIGGLFLPNASFIRVLAIDLPGTRNLLSPEELSRIRRFLHAAKRVLHLAVVWHIWEQFGADWGVLQLRSLYLIWDGAFGISSPSLANLQHPAKLTDITIYAPVELEAPSTGPFADFCLPGTILEDCINLACLTYASNRPPFDFGNLSEDIARVMWVLVDSSERFLSLASEEMVSMDQQVHPNFFTAHMRFSHEVLGHWLAKMEGNQSLLSANGNRPEEEFIRHLRRTGELYNSFGIRGKTWE